MPDHQNLLDFIRERARGADEPLACHYVECDADDFEHPQYADFCHECATAAVADYCEARGLDVDDGVDAGIYIGGGYSSDEKDSTPFCEVCCVQLDCSLTEYGIEQELEHFEKRRPRYLDIGGWADFERAIGDLPGDHACWRWVAEHVKAARAEGAAIARRAIKLAAQPGMSTARADLLAVLAERATRQAHKPSFRLWDEMREYLATPRDEREATSRMRARGRRLLREADRFLGNFGYSRDGWDCFDAPYGGYWWPFVVEIEQHRIWQTPAFLEGQAALHEHRALSVQRGTPRRRWHAKGGLRPLVSRRRHHTLFDPHPRDANPYPADAVEHGAWDGGFISAIRKTR